MVQRNRLENMGSCKARHHGFPRRFCHMFPCRQASPRLYCWQYPWEHRVSNSQKRAIQNYRSRLGERGLARFEVLGLDADRALIRSVARRLAEDGPEASRLRTIVSQTIEGEPPKKGGILAALRRSPLVGADIEPVRARETGRKLRL